MSRPLRMIMTLTMGSSSQNGKAYGPQVIAALLDDGVKPSRLGSTGAGNQGQPMGMRGPGASKTVDTRPEEQERILESGKRGRTPRYGAPEVSTEFDGVWRPATAVLWRPGNRVISWKPDNRFPGRQQSGVQPRVGSSKGDRQIILCDVQIILCDSTLR